MIEKTADTIDGAKFQALLAAKNEYGVSEEDLDFEVIDEPVNKLFKKIPAKVRVTLKPEAVERIEKEKEEKRRLEEERKAAEEQEKLRLQAEFEENLCKKIEEVHHILPDYMHTLMSTSYMVAVSMVSANGKFTENDMVDDLAEVFDTKYEINRNNPKGNRKAFEEFFDLMLKRHLDISRYRYEINGWDSVINDLKTGLYDELDTRSDIYTKLSFGRFEDFTDDGNQELGDMHLLVDDILGELRYNLILLINYIKYIYSTPVLFADIENAKMLLSNEELTKIVMNSHDGSIMVTEDYDRYSMYTNYYKDVFGDTELSEPVFRNAANVAILINKLSENFDKRISLLKEVEIDPDSISQTIYDNRLEGETIFHYLLVNLLENGKLDSIMASENSYELFKYLISHLAMKALRDGVSVYLIELKEAVAVHQKEITYSEKYKLLHPNGAKEAKDKIVNDLANAITGVDFENVLKELYEQKGYLVETTKTTGDQGADLIIEKGGIRTVVQAKYYSSPVGNAAVQEVVAAIKFYNADAGIVVTNNSFTDAAKELAEANDIQLIDGVMLNKMIERL